MTRDEVTRLAMESGITRVMDESSYRWLLEGREPVIEVFIKFAELVAAAERKDCADIAEYWSCNGMPRTMLADQIRARGLQELNKEAEKNGEEL